MSPIFSAVIVHNRACFVFNVNVLWWEHFRKPAARVAEQRERHNRNVAGVYRPEHRKATQRIARALRELVDANRAEQELRDKAPGGQFPPMDFPGIGQLGAAGGPAKFWMEHARRHGYLLDDHEANLPSAAL